MKIHLLYILSLILFTGTLQAQNFVSHKLSDLNELLPKSCLPAKDSVFNCPQISKDKSLIVKYNEKYELVHLGISLFSDETKELANRPVCDFIERIMMELLLLEKTKGILPKLDEYRITLTRNYATYGSPFFTSLYQLLNDMQNPARFALNRQDLVYTALWEFGSKEVFAIVFPASRELIFGTDKKEADALLGDLLANENCEPAYTEKLANVTEIEAISGSELYKYRGTMFMIPEINADTYYLPINNKLSIAFDSRYPVESLANIFLSGNIDSNLSLHLTHRMYGRFTSEFTVLIKKFLCIFDRDFSIYCLLHSKTSDKVQLSVILCNKYFNYFHLLRIKTTEDQIFSEKGILTADFYTNIPKHNIQSLFNHEKI